MRWQACPGHHYARKSVAPDKGKHSLCNGKHCNHSRELGGGRGEGEGRYECASYAWALAQPCSNVMYNSPEYRAYLWCIEAWYRYSDLG